MNLIPEGTSKDTMYLAAIHKAILQINSAAPEQKEKSALWLRENGFEVAVSQKGVTNGLHPNLV